MSNATQFTGGAKVPTGLINGASALPLLSYGGGALGGPMSALAKVTTGALTANALATALSVSGGGVLSFVGASSLDSTSRTHRLKITVDGNVVFDAASASTTSADAMATAVGALAVVNGTGTSLGLVPESIPFNKSLLIEYASSITETAKSAVWARYFPSN